MTPNTEKHAAHVAIEAWLGDDLTANTDERIYSSYLVDYAGEHCDGFLTKKHDGGEPAWILLLPENQEFTASPEQVKCAADFWNNRHGQPWQSALEQHVAAYRRPPRDFAANTPEGLWLCHTVLLPALEAAGLMEAYMHRIVGECDTEVTQDSWGECLLAMENAAKVHRATTAQIVQAAVAVLPRGEVKSV